MTDSLPFPAGKNADSVPLILASGSQARQQMLRAAGLEVHLHPANVDEESFRTALRADRVTTESAAEALAERLDAQESALYLADAGAIRVRALHAVCVSVGIAT